MQQLCGELQKIVGLEIKADGSGDIEFKVQLSGRTGNYASFLWVNSTLEKSYVQWHHQGVTSDICRQVWGPLVKNRDNGDGSELHRDVTVDEIIRAAKEYADESRRATP
jgi:hypothetical protein